MAQASLAQARSWASGNVRRPAKYGLRLWTKTGLRTKSYRYAVFYEIRFGRDIIQDQKRFHSSTRTASQKQAYIERLVQRFEFHRQAILAVKREEINRKARETRERRTREKAEAEKKARLARERKALRDKERRLAKKIKKLRLEKERIEREEAEVPEEMKEAVTAFSELIKNFPALIELAQNTPELIEKEVVREDLARYEEPTLRGAVNITDVRMVPVLPKNKFYEKAHIYKTIETQEGIADIFLLLVNLHKKFWLLFNDRNFDDARLVSLFLFSSHFFPLFPLMLREGDTFQFRIKYRVKRGSRVSDSAISLRRTQITNIDRLVTLYDDTFSRFLRKMKKSNMTYLEGGATLWITGFTLENFAARN